METVTEAQLDKRIADFRAEVGYRFDAVDSRFTAVDERFTSIDQRFTSIDQRFTAVEERLGRIEDQLAAQRLETIAAFQHLHARFDGFYRVLVGAAFVMIAALIGLIATQL